MLKLLIAESSDEFADRLVSEFCNEFDICLCSNGKTALEYLHSFQPDAMIVNFFLTGKDGLTLLQECSRKPPAILGLTPYWNNYIALQAADAGVRSVIRLPASFRIIREYLLELVNTPPKPHIQVAKLLHLLNFHTHLDGYAQLCLAIPLFAEDSGLRMSKEIYPAIAAQLSVADPRSVEHSIRHSIADAWARRDPAVWESHFPRHKTAPTNKEFISQMAEYMKYKTLQTEYNTRP